MRTLALLVPGYVVSSHGAAILACCLLPAKFIMCHYGRILCLKGPGKAMARLLIIGYVQSNDVNVAKAFSLNSCVV